MGPSLDGNDCFAARHKATYHFDSLRQQTARISAQVYLDMDDMDRLATAVQKRVR